jgi:single-strand DNA-binding protein
MPAVNKVFLMGNLTRTPELRYTPSGAAICEFGIAINRRYTSNGVKKDETTFIEVNVWQRQAEMCQKRLQKGSLVMIEGRLKTDQWEDKDTGKRRSRVLVVAESINFVSMPPRMDEADYGQEQGQQRQQSGSQRPQQYAKKEQGREGSEDANSSQHSSHSTEAPPPPEPEYDASIEDDDNVPF